MPDQQYGQAPKSTIDTLLAWLDEQIDRLNSGDDPLPPETAPPL